MRTRKLGPVLLTGFIIGPILGSGIIILPPLAYGLLGSWALPAWVAITLIGALFALTFTVYITNADMKLVEVIYNKLIAFHERKDVDEKL